MWERASMTGRRRVSTWALLSADFSGKNPLERLKCIDLPPGCDIIPLTPKEFTSLLQKRDPIAIEAINKGVIIRDDYLLGDMKPP